MRRRTLMAALGTALSTAGCLDGGSPIGGPPGGSTGTPDTRTPSTGGTPADGTPDGGADDDVTPDGGMLDASIVDLETAPRTYALSRTGYRTAAGAEVGMTFAATATADHPARLVAELHNPMDVDQTFDLSWAPPFGRWTSEQPYRPGAEPWSSDDTYRVELVFAPTADHDLVESPPSVERTEDGYWRLAHGVSPWGPDRVRLSPGETVRGEYAVVGRADGAGKGRPTGIYEFGRGQSDPVRLAVWNTDRPGPSADSRFGGESVPSLPGEEAVAWYHEADAATPTYVRPSVERTDLPAEVRFTFVNHSREALGCGHWSLYKRHGGRWFHLGPYVRTMECRMVPPGGAKTWELHAHPGEGVDCQGAAVYGHLGGGQYAAVVGYGHDAPRSGAMVELTGDPVAVTPTDDVSAERDGDRVTVDSPRPTREEREPVTLTVSRADGADRTVIAEQVMRRRFRGLRNTLSFFEAGVERVALHTDDTVAEQAVGYDRSTTRFTFRGDAYEATVDN
jgi:hypothetical protein